MTTATDLPTFLPGRLWIERGTPADFRALERFHYRRGRPATWAGVYVIRYDDVGAGACHGADHLPLREESRGVRRGGCHSRAGSPCHNEGRVVAVAVVSYPTVNSGARDRALGLTGLGSRERLGFVNGNVRVISRVVVHPQFRALGLAGALVRHCLREAETRYTEAFAVMGRVHPFFERGGMRCVERPGDGPWYYLFDREGVRG